MIFAIEKVDNTTYSLDLLTINERIMNKKLFTLFTALLFSIVVSALPFQEARKQAWFLTDKMAYALNLNPAQCDRVYEVNLEYFMQINSQHDCHGRYWDYRNTDLRYILHDWQYQLYSTISYFLTPLHWTKSNWVFDIYKHYRDGYYYFNRPTIYVSYCGGKWNHRKSHTKSPYMNMHFKQGGGLKDQYHSGRPAGHQHHPEYGRPSHERSSTQRPSQNRPTNRPSTQISNNTSNKQSARPSQNNSNRRTNASSAPSSNKNNRAASAANKRTTENRERSFGR